MESEVGDLRLHLSINAGVAASIPCPAACRGFFLFLALLQPLTGSPTALVERLPTTNITLAVIPSTFPSSKTSQLRGAPECLPLRSRSQIVAATAAVTTWAGHARTSGSPECSITFPVW